MGDYTANSQLVETSPTFVHLLGITGLLFTFVSALVATLPSTWSGNSVFKLPLTYEGIAYLCFVLSPLSLLYFLPTGYFQQTKCEAFLSRISFRDFPND